MKTPRFWMMLFQKPWLLSMGFEVIWHTTLICSNSRFKPSVLPGVLMKH